MAMTDEQIERYSRHIILKEVGAKGQKKLLKGKVLIIGAGGLGAPAAMYLAAAGVGTIGIVDADEVDLSNLQRQIIHSTTDIGKAKVKSAKETMNAMNPDVEVKTYRMFVDASNIRELIREYDFIIDAIVQSALELGFIYALVAMALFLSFRVLNIADMTTDGAFTLGCAVSATAAVAGHPFLGFVLAMLAGACAGFVTAFLQTHLGVPSILAGIITNTGLYTVNLAIMGFSSNVPMLKTETVFTMARALFGEKSPYKLIVAVTVTVVACALLILFLGTRLGLSIRATGDNPDMVRASSINTAFTITVGLCVSNAMTSLSGAVLAQYQKSADINLGTGMVVIGLASLIIGETLFGRGGMWVKAAAAVAGSVIYRFIIALALRANVPSECLKLISAVIVALAIAAPALKKNLALRRRRAVSQKGGKTHA